MAQRTGGIRSNDRSDAKSPGGESGHSHGSAQSHHDSDEHGNPSVCLLEFVDEEWVTPMHFACDPVTKVLSPLDGSEEAARTH